MKLYSVKYKSPKGWRFHTIRKVKKHWIDPLTTDMHGHPRYWGVQKENGDMFFIPLDWVFVIKGKVVEATIAQIRKETGIKIS